jgi:alkylation response protein AidB-like acyl-CoA dehydrogenase
MLGPVLLEYGNEAQKLEHLPKIARGEIRWCQGYSEPGAGSDLASLRTSAVLDGDEYVVNGTKIWTSYAHLSDWIFCLVRTDPQATKHKGISFILIDMESEGIRAEPIQLISGSSQFCEVRFGSVRVPCKNMVGEQNAGWEIAKKLLQHERNMVAGIGSRGSSRNRRYSMEGQAKKYVGESDGKIADASLRDRITRHKMDNQAFALTSRRSELEARSNASPSAASSILKFYGTELNKRRLDLMVEVMGFKALGRDGSGFSQRELQINSEWLRSKANSIEGGTSEIQLNIISKRVLGLPD